MSERKSNANFLVLPSLSPLHLEFPTYITVGLKSKTQLLMQLPPPPNNG